MSPFVVLIPEHRRGHGLGHMSRALRLASALRPRAVVYVPLHIPAARRGALTEFAASKGARDLVTGELPKGTEPVLFILDRRRLDTGEVLDLRRAGAVVAVDGSGPGRRHCDYLIDILPRVDHACANVRDLRLLELPGPRVPDNDRRWGGGASEVPRESRRALVTFGGDDPAGMTKRTVRSLLRTGEFAAGRVDVLMGPMRASDPGIDDNSASAVNVVHGPIDLASALSEYTHVFTSFGLTAFEAVAAGAEVILVNASRYHERLARRVGFRAAGVRRVSAGLIRKRMYHANGSVTVRRLLLGNEDVSLSRTVSELVVPPLHGCPVCGQEGTVVGRFELRTYLRCAVCGMVFLKSFEAPRSYQEDYFFEEYRAQYGRTYLEDAEHIKAMGRRRLEEIRASAPASGAPPLGTRSANPTGPVRLLDIGCAYGPFLSAAAECGHEVVGIDPSEAAVSYVTSELGVAAHRSTVEELQDVAARPEGLEDGSFDVVTMWYVIEHLTDVASALRTVSGLLEEGGVFAFSTPNLRGVSGRTRFTEFLSRSPADHFSIWSPRTARRVLERFGFEVRRIRVTGHHPERFPLIAPREENRNGLWGRVLLWVSRALRLGDTFEVYAAKRATATGAERAGRVSEGERRKSGARKESK